MARKQTKARRGRGRGGKSNRRTRRNGRKMMRGGGGLLTTVSYLASAVRGARKLTLTDFKTNFSAIRDVGGLSLYVLTYTKPPEESMVFDFSKINEKGSLNMGFKDSQFNKSDNKQKIVNGILDILKIAPSAVTVHSFTVKSSLSSELQDPTFLNNPEFQEFLSSLKITITVPDEIEKVKSILINNPDKNMMFKMQ